MRSGAPGRGPVELPVGGGGAATGAEEGMERVHREVRRQPDQRVRPAAVRLHLPPAAGCGDKLLLQAREDGGEVPHGYIVHDLKDRAVRAVERAHIQPKRRGVRGLCQEDIEDVRRCYGVYA